MDYERFKEEVTARLTDFYGHDAEVSIREVRKNNGVILDGVNIVFQNQDESRIVPVIYLNSFFTAFSEGVQDIEEIVGEIVDLRDKHATPEFGYDQICSLNNWDSVKEMIYPMLLSSKSNEELLKTCINRPFLDLSIIYTIRLQMDGPSIGTVKITRDLFSSFGISEQELHDQAIKNMEQEQYELKDITEILASLMPESMEGDECVKGGQMLVLTNKSRQYGAAGILDREILRQFGKDAYILPSSIHETILVPAEEGMNEEDLDRMVKEVNSTQVEEQEVLSDHVYYFSFESDEIRMRAAA